MLKVRVIPTLLWREHGLVKGVRFDSWRRTGTILPAVKVYNARDVDELIVVDITASRDGRAVDGDWVKGFAPYCFVPLTAGGGITRPDQVTNLIQAGADKVSIGTAAYANPELIRGTARHFGSQCVVASIDVRRAEDGSPICVAQSGKCPTPHHPVDWAREVERRGAGEILLTSVDRDGTMEGYDLELIESVSSAVNLPVIASGGAGNYDHMIEAVCAGASAVAAASIFHFTEQTPAGAKKALAAAGIPVRHSLGPDS